LLVLQAEPDDRRSKVLRLTPERRRVLAEAVPIWTREQELVESRLGQGGAERLPLHLKTASK
jgi:DNA-binding MarR family transcriptional regulator